MSLRPVTHATFAIERRYTAAPARVFAAWSRAEAKLRWFFCNPDWPVADYALDFREGGFERVRTGPAGGPVHACDARYHEIVENARIVYAYEMRVGDRWLSVSLVTVEFQPQGGGTRMLFTEQGAYFDGPEAAREREHGTAIGLDNLDAELARAP
jgi:uncharacterized protein YndB with AHSA1/START domain